MMKNLEQYIYDKLNAMQTEKSTQKVEPCLVTKAELFSSIDKDVRTILNKWFVEKKIKVHKTVHAPAQDYVELIKE